MIRVMKDKFMFSKYSAMAFSYITRAGADI